MVSCEWSVRVITVARDELVVYTCITGGYEELRPVESREAGVRYVCLTDGVVGEPRGWEIRVLDLGFRDPVLSNRFAKMHPHLYFPEHERSVYVDGTFTVRQGVRAIAERALSTNDFALYQHPFRDCVRAEGSACALAGHAWLWAFVRQLRAYAHEGLPAPSGLYECNILFRRHNSPEVVSLMEKWWIAFLHGVRRDQLSLPYLLWKSGTSVQQLGQSHIRQHNPAFGFALRHRARVRWGTTVRGYLNRLLLPNVWLERVAPSVWQ
jgi:hypothetical protein